MKRRFLALLIVAQVLVGVPASADPVVETVGLVDPDTGV